MVYSFFVKNTYSITKAQANFPKVVRECRDGAIAITKHDEAVAYVISRERLESFFETMEILANPKAMEALRKDRQGKLKYYPLESLDED